MNKLETFYKIVNSDEHAVNGRWKMESLMKKQEIENEIVNMEGQAFNFYTNF